MMFYNKGKGNWFDWFIENPLKTYYKVKNIWKPPTLHFNFQFNKPFGNVAKILEIRSFDVGWKDKFNSPRHERDPFIEIIIFNRFKFTWWWIFEIDGNDKYDLMYWESILDYLYYGYDTPDKAIHNNVWQHPRGDTYYTTPVEKFLL